MTPLSTNTSTNVTLAKEAQEYIDNKDWKKAQETIEKIQNAHFVKVLSERLELKKLSQELGNNLY